MTKDELTRQQHIDIMRAYREVAPTCRTQAEAWVKTNLHPAPRYYISSRNAWDRLRLMVMGDFSVVDAMKPNRRRLYYSLFDKLMEISQRREYQDCSLWFICQFLVSQPAPEFFLTSDAIKRIFIYVKKYGFEFRYSKINEIKKGRKD